MDEGGSEARDLFPDGGAFDGANNIHEVREIRPVLAEFSHEGLTFDYYRARLESREDRRVEIQERRDGTGAQCWIGLWGDERGRKLGLMKIVASSREGLLQVLGIIDFFELQENFIPVRDFDEFVDRLRAKMGEIMGSCADQVELIY
jgi:hypothetical protein